MDYYDLNWIVQYAPLYHGAVIMIDFSEYTLVFDMNDPADFDRISHQSHSTSDRK